MYCRRTKWASAFSEMTVGVASAESLHLRYLDPVQSSRGDKPRPLRSVGQLRWVDTVGASCLWVRPFRRAVQ